MNSPHHGGQMALGRQMTIEFYDCDAAVLADDRLLEQIFVDSARKSGATVLESFFHDFQPQGVSGVVIISESHFTIHAWPEHDYAAVDIFTCGDGIDFEVAINELQKGLKSASRIVSSEMYRGLVGNNGMERLVPVFECGEQHYALSWRERFENTGAWGLLATIDVYGVTERFLSGEAAIRDFAVAYGKELGLCQSCPCEVAVLPEQSYALTLRSQNARLSVRVCPKRQTVYLDLLNSRFFEPREAAEAAVKLLSGKHYRMQVTVRQ